MSDHVAATGTSSVTSTPRSHAAQTDGYEGRVDNSWNGIERRRDEIGRQLELQRLRNLLKRNTP